MRIGNTFSALLLAVFTVFVHLGSAPLLNALPSLSKSSIKVGMSPRVQKNTWATLNCTIDNPDSRAYEGYLRLVDEGSFMGRRTVFSENLTIPANASLRYGTDIMVEDTGNFHVELYVENKRVPGVDSVVIQTMNEKEEQFCVLNDSPDVSMGAVNQLDAFKKKCFQLQFSYKELPLHWSSLKSFFAVVVLRPDFKSYSSRQYRAIIDYVRQGGIIIFADPEGALEAAKTPLAELLPVNPLRIRKITELQSVKKIFPEFKEWGDANPVDFLESYPGENSLVWLKESQFPVFCWKKVGFGEARYSAVSLSGDILEKTGSWEKTMMFFLNHQQRVADTRKISGCLDEMTGYTVPGAGLVKTVFFWYFFFLALITGAGIYFRKGNIALVGAVILSLIVTYCVFGMVASGTAKNTSMLVASVEARYPAGDTMAVDAYYGIFSRKDTSETFMSRNENTRFSAIAPGFSRMLASVGADSSKGFMGKKTTDPMEVLCAYGIPQVFKLNIRTSATRQMNAMFSVDVPPSKEIPLPEITYTEKGFSFKEWQCPQGMKYDFAFLAFPGKIMPLSGRSGKLTYDPDMNESFSRGDNIMATLADSLRFGFKTMKPSIALVSTGETSMKFNDSSYQSRIINFIPVMEKIENEKIYIGPESIVLSSADSSSRSIIPGNELLSQIYSQSSVDYKILFKLPPMYALMIPEEIDVKLVYFNDTMSVGVAPKLLLSAGQSAAANKKGPERQISGEKKSDSEYVFTKDLDKAVNPYSGEGVLVLSVNLKNTDTSMSEKLRANKWLLKELSVGVKGRIRPDIAPLSY
ncbi:MAG: hypothetical protein WC637_03075 [Victivallales bacterium]